MLGLDSNRLGEKGITLLEGMIATVIVGIGFVAVFQMVNYSIQSIDLSGERTKTTYLASMVAEDLIGDRFSVVRDPVSKKDVNLYKHLSNDTQANSFAFQIASCGGKKKTNPYIDKDVPLENKISKWQHSLSENRIKCRSNDTKSLKVYEICRDNVKDDSGKKRTFCVYGNDTLFNRTYIGRMVIRMNDGIKTKAIYFPVY